MLDPIGASVHDLMQQDTAGAGVVCGGGVHPTIGELRPVLELAWAVAKAGTQTRPPIPPPGRMRPLMRFGTLPDRGLTTVRQILEEDADFRARVAEWADRANLDEAAWLWLVHLSGGEAELGTMSPAAQARASGVEEERERPGANRHLTAVDRLDAGVGADIAPLRQINATAELEDRLQAEADRRPTQVALGEAEAARVSAEESRRTRNEERARSQEAVGAYQSRVMAAAPTDSELRPALELAWAVAKAGAQARPPIPPPGGMRALMRFGTLPDRALTTVRQVVEEHADFRARVVEWADRANLDEAARLWLAHPLGGKGEPGTISSAAHAGEVEEEEEEKERPGATGNLTAADRLGAGIGADVAPLRQIKGAAELQDRREPEPDRRPTQVSLGQAEAQLDPAEVARQTADEERARLQETVAVLESRVSSLVTRPDDMVAPVNQGGQRRDTTSDEIVLLTDQLAQARSETARWQAEREASELARGQAEAERDAAGVARQTADEERARLQDTVGPLESRVSSLVTDLDQAVARLTEASQERDTAHDEIAKLTGQLQRARAELARLQAGQDEMRSAAGRGIARAAEAARLLSETLAEVALSSREIEVRGESAGVFEHPGAAASPETDELAWVEPSLGHERLAEYEQRPEGRRARQQDERLAEYEHRPEGRRARQQDERLAEYEHRPEGRRARQQDDRASRRAWGAEDRLPSTPEVETASAERLHPMTRRRRPLRLPPAVFYDSFEAADYLVRVPGILLIVDGHNVTNLSSPDLELSRQRHQLVDALAELAKGTGRQVHVVLEQADLSGWFEPPAPNRSQMRVTFSRLGVPPDQVIRELIDQLDLAQAVVVATNDRQLQEWVRRHGGNVVSVPQLQAVLSRSLDSERASGALPRFRRRRG
jgi:predicted RNA-binding protein with PIN domain